MANEVHFHVCIIYHKYICPGEIPGQKGVTGNE